MDMSRGLHTQAHCVLFCMMLHVQHVKDSTEHELITVDGGEAHE